MKQDFTKINKYAGWATFAISFLVYFLTVEPSASLWDCGEFISAAYKLDIGHPPGAPLFMLIGRIASFFSFGDVTMVAFWVNMVSVIASAFTIFFLYHSIIFLARKLVKAEDGEYNSSQHILIILSGVIGAVSFTFTDTFWFNAVEAEVYATSSFFTAIVFWAILKWESVADEKGAAKWLVLIAFLIGLSTGVHLLNLLCIPAIGFIIYFKKFPKTTIVGMLVTFVLSAFVLYVIQNWVIIGLPDMAQKFEVTFAIDFGLPILSGIIVFMLLLVYVIVHGIIISQKDNVGQAEKYIYYTLVGLFLLSMGIVKFLFVSAIIVGGYFLAQEFIESNFKQKLQHFFNLAMLMFAFIVIGYSSYALIVVRSTQEPVLNENNPGRDVMAFISFLKREQYGEWDVGIGHQFNERPSDYVQGDDKYILDNGKYIVYDTYMEAEYGDGTADARMFPRMPRGGDKADEYMQWLAAERGLQYNNDTKKQIMASTITTGENFKFFWKVQLSNMYLRYFGWNFIGREGDVKGRIPGQSIAAGVSFPGFDKEEGYTTLEQSLARNKYYGIPLVLGLIGLFFQFKRNTKDGLVVLSLFFFTGIAIMLYLNGPALEPRERDYAYVGSYYAFAIWIGLGTLGVADFILSKLKDQKKTIIATVVLTAITPTILAVQNWDDHNRSGRYYAIDQAKNLLRGIDKHAIVFTAGDNDTFPLWYLQEVEGYRTDVRVCNLSLLGTDWYVEQMKKKAYDSEGLPISIQYKTHRQEQFHGIMSTMYEFRTDKNGVFKTDKKGNLMPVYEIDELGKLKKDKDGKYVIKKATVDVDKVMTAIVAEKEFTLAGNRYGLIETERGTKAAIWPSELVSLTINVDKVKEYNWIPEESKKKLKNEMEWKLPFNRNSTLQRSHIAMIDIINGVNKGDWERPVYFSITAASPKSMLGLNKFTYFDGYCFRLMPCEQPTPVRRNKYGYIELDSTYKVMMESQWRGMNNAGIFYDVPHKNMVSIYRGITYETAAQFIDKNELDKAKALMSKAKKDMPIANLPIEVRSNYNSTSDMELAIQNYVDIYKKDSSYREAIVFINELLDLAEYDFEIYETRHQKIIDQEEINTTRDDLFQAFGYFKSLNFAYENLNKENEPELYKRLEEFSKAYFEDFKNVVNQTLMREPQDPKIDFQKATQEQQQAYFRYMQEKQFYDSRMIKIMHVKGEGDAKKTELPSNPQLESDKQDNSEVENVDSNEVNEKEVVDTI